MSNQTPIFDEIEHGILSGVHRAEGWFDRNPKPPAQPDAATAAPTPAQEDDMSLLTDVEEGWTALEGEVGKFKAALPGALEKAKAFEASPFAQLAEKVAGTVLPPEAVAVAVNAADKVLDDLLALYTPQTAPATPAEPAVPVQ